MTTPDRDFAGLYDEHLDFVWRNLRALGVPMADVEDAAQDTFVVAYRRRDDFRPGGSMRAWLYGIARRVAYRQRRGGGRRARLADAFSIEPRESPSLEGLAQTQQAWAVAMSVLDALPDAQREAYWLTEFEGLTAAQAGRALGVSGNTISSRLRTARQGLARHGEVLRARDERERQRVGRPTAAQRRSVAAALTVRLGALSKAAAPGLGLGVWVTIAAVVVAGVGIGAALLPGSPPKQMKEPVVEAANPAVPVASVPPEPVMRTPAAPEPVAPDPAPEPLAVPIRAPSRAMTPASDPAPTLAAEAKLVRAIKAAVTTDPKRGLELVAEHDARFPRGVLSAEAASLRVDALCRLGQESEAKQAAAAIPRTHPSATVATAGCPQKKSTSPTSAGETRGI